MLSRLEKGRSYTQVGVSILLSLEVCVSVRPLGLSGWNNSSNVQLSPCGLSRRFACVGTPEPMILFVLL